MKAYALTLLVLLNLSALVTQTALRGRITATSVALAFSAWTIMRLVQQIRKP